MRDEKKPGADAGQMQVNEQEQNLLLILRKIDYGEVRIVMKNGVPIHIEEIKKSIKL